MNAAAPSADQGGFTRRLLDWMCSEGAKTLSVPYLIDSYCQFLNREGFAVRRCNFATEALHPLMSNTRHVWSDHRIEPASINPAVIVDRRQYYIGDAMIDEVFFNSGSQTNPQYVVSPFHRVEQVGELYEPILPLGSEQAFPVFSDLAELGCTGYYAARLDSFEGMLQKMGLATDRPGGFDNVQRERLRESVGMLTLHVNALMQCAAKQTLARVYVGQDPGRRVCAGMISVGQVVSLDAAIWFSDLRNYTSISEGLPAERLLDSLNAYFDCIVTAIYDGGGEVLKYIGDAVLAVFPVDEHGSRSTACAAALSAAKACAAALEGLNGAREASREPLFAHGIALHVGEVRYGNIGGRERLDFTVIGRAVNVASRIESVCKELGEPLLCSAAFAEEAGITGRDLGAYALKGVAEPVPLCVPAD